MQQAAWADHSLIRAEYFIRPSSHTQIYDLFKHSDYPYRPLHSIWTTNVHTPALWKIKKRERSVSKSAYGQILNLSQFHTVWILSYGFNIIFFRKKYFFKKKNYPHWHKTVRPNSKKEKNWNSLHIQQQNLKKKKNWKRKLLFPHNKHQWKVCYVGYFAVVLCLFSPTIIYNIFHDLFVGKSFQIILFGKEKMYKKDNG